MTCFLQVAPVATFFFMLDFPVWFFFKLCLSMDFLPAHTSPSLTSFSGCAHRWLFPRSRLSLILLQVTHVADFFLDRTSTSMTSFSGCAHRWLFPSRARCWFSPGYARRWSIFPCRTIPSVTSFSDCACQWLLFHRSRHSQHFVFMLVLPLFFFSSLCLSMDFLPARTSPSLISFSGCACRRLFFTGRARCWLLFRLSTSLTLSQAAPFADFSPGYACRWFFFRVARVRRWLPSEVAHIADFFHWLLPLLIFPRVTQVTDLFFLVAGFPRWLLFQIVPVNDLFFTGRASRNLFFLVGFAAAIFFQVVLIDGLFASSHESFADFFFRLRSSLFFFHRSRPSLTSISGCAHRWLFPRSRLSLIVPQVTHVADFLPGRTSTSMTSFSGCAHRWLFFLCRARWWFFSRLRTSLISFSWSHDSVADFFFRLSLSMTSFSQVAPVADFSPPYDRRCFLFPGHTVPSLTSFADCVCHGLFFHKSRQSQPFFFMLVLPLFFFQVVLIDGFFASSHESFPDFFFSLRTSLTFFTGRAPCWFLFQVAHIADSFPGRARRWFFPRLRMSLIILPGGTSTSMTSFLGCAHRWRFHWSRPLLTIPQVTEVADFFFLFARFPRRLLFQIVPVNDCFFTGRASRNVFFMLFLPLFFFQVVAIDELLLARTSLSLTSFSGCARRWIFSQVAPVADIFLRSLPSLTSISGCAHRWLFPRSRPLMIFPHVTHVADFLFLVARLRRWLLFQIEPVDYFFFTGRASQKTFFSYCSCRCYFFSKLCLSMNFLPARMSPSMTSFSGCARRWLFHRSLTSFSVCGQVVAIDEFFASSHESVADFFLQVASVADIFHRSLPLLTFFLGCARRWLLFQVAHIADFFPGRARWWFFTTLRTSLISFSWSHDSIADFFFRLSLSMTSFSQVAPVKKTFFMLLLSLLFFFRVVLIDEFFASSLESFDDFFFRLRPTLTFSQVADFFFSLRTSLTFFQVAAVADFSPGYACRWFFSRVARVRRWLPS